MLVVWGKGLSDGENVNLGIRAWDWESEDPSSVPGSDADILCDLGQVT